MDTNTVANQFSLELFYDQECGVWSGTSKDIPGLFLEAESVSELLKEGEEMIPYLLAENLHHTAGEVLVQVDIKSETKESNPVSNEVRTTYAMSGKTVSLNVDVALQESYGNT